MMEIVETRELGVSPVRTSARDLVFRAQDGDLAAYEALYRAHVGRIHALCRRMTGNPERAEELTQETFVRAWEKLDGYRAESAFSTWLGRVAVNVVLGDRRSRSRRRRREEQAGDVLAFDHASRELRPGSGLDLDQAIARLPARARMVFLLHDVEGYRHEEIAGLLDISAGTSKAQLHRARKLLREALR